MPVAEPVCLVKVGSAPERPGSKTGDKLTECAIYVRPKTD